MPVAAARRVISSTSRCGSPSAIGALYDFYLGNGRDVNATAKEFDCSVQTVYKRVRMIETAEFNERQGALFANEIGS